MPEGPECKVIAEGLNKILGKKTIVKFEFVSGRYSKNPPTGFEEFANNYPCYVTEVHCKGKFIYFEIKDRCSEDGRRYIFHTLGMTGNWTRHPTPLTRAILHYEDGTLYYNDQRNFGTFKFCVPLDDLIKKLHKDLGVDFLHSSYNNGFREDYSKKRSYTDALAVLKLKRNLSKTLAQVLMNQKNFAGVGNYVKAEALYRARLSPHRTVESLSDDDKSRLVRSIADVLQESLDSKRPDLLDYRDEPGQETGFKKVVYKRSKGPLGNPVKSEHTKDKRTTYWVPAVQK